MKIRTYSELIRIPTFEERFEYLKIGGVVGRETFGFDRYVNQSLYHSKEWQDLRQLVLIRDDGCDLAIDDRQVFSRATIHHINPITLLQFENMDQSIFDPENLITTSQMTHNAIHYGDKSLLSILPVERKKGDTCLWTAY